MKKLLASTAIAGLGIVLSVAAFAVDKDSTDITVNATAENTCYIASDPNILNLSGFTVGTNNSSTTELTLDNFIDTTTALLTNGDGEITLLYDDVYCNYAHTISIKSANGGLANISGTNIVGGSFLSHINYQVGVTHGNNTSGFFVTSGVPGQKLTFTPNSTGAFRGALTILVNLFSNNTNTPVLAGDYSDTATIQLGAPL